MRRSRRERQQRAAAIRRHALHEAAHCAMAVYLGVPIYYAVVWGGGGKTVLAPATTIASERAALAVSGLVGECLAPDGPMSPRSWVQQPDHAELARLSPAETAGAFQSAMSVLLADPDASAAVLAIAGRLERRHLLLGWQIRATCRDPSRYPPRPPKRRGKQPPPGYVRRSLGG